jgi:hypothetical protein
MVERISGAEPQLQLAPGVAEPEGAIQGGIERNVKRSRNGVSAGVSKFA